MKKASVEEAEEGQEAEAGEEVEEESLQEPLEDQPAAETLHPQPSQEHQALSPWTPGCRETLTLLLQPAEASRSLEEVALWSRPAGVAQEEPPTEL